MASGRGRISCARGRHSYRAATPLSQDFQTRTTRLVARRLVVGVIQIAGLLPLIQLIAKP
jgi:hypothetical protein